MTKPNKRAIENRILPLAVLTPHARNYNRHGDAQIADLRESLRQFGQVRSVVVQADKAGKHFVIVAGHGIAQAAQAEGYTELRADVIPHSWSETRVLAYLAADNELGKHADPDADQLAAIVREVMEAEGEALARLAAGEQAALDAILNAGNALSEAADAGELVDKAAELQKKWQVQRGDVWEIGKHRLMCGDSTSAEDVAKLFGSDKAILCDADPPYGMGKENEGIANDNLYREKLDKFQMAWWGAWRPFLEDNASAYIWGNSDDLWRLWYCGGLRDSERLTFRNEIIWKKGGAQGIASESHRQYPTASERCLVFMLGEQGFNNNADNYWDGWEPIRQYLVSQRDIMGWGAKNIEEICGVGMHSHWFSKSQWQLITEEHYEKLQRATHGKAFKREFDELKREFYATRAFFDNTHDNMTDVWDFPRVTGDERRGHATPKPVAMMERIIKTSAPSGGIVAVPFVGSAPDFVACEQTGRIGRGMEIEPKYCAVTLERMSLLGLAPRKVTAK